MIANFWVISQIFGLAIVAAVSLYALWEAVQILRGWDFNRRDEEQLALERKTYLVSTLVQYALAFQVISFLLLIATADYLHNVLRGAMCAFGAFNANSYGFKAFWMKIAAIFFYFTWIIVNHIDTSSEEYPLVRPKYALLFALLPLLFLDIFLELSYFANVNPNVITSCCSSVYRTTANPYGAVAMGLPLQPSLLAFSTLLPLALMLLYLSRRKDRFYSISGILAVIAFGLSLLGMFTFLSPYYNVVLFGLPTSHYCPFEVLKLPALGYPLYAFLFLGGIAGFSLPVLELLKKKPSLEVAGYQKQLSLYSLMGLSIFFLATISFIATYYSEVGTVIYH